MFYTLNVFYPHIHRLSPRLGTRFAIRHKYFRFVENFRFKRECFRGWFHGEQRIRLRSCADNIDYLKQVFLMKQKMTPWVIFNLCGLG